MEVVQLALTKVKNYIELHNLFDWFTYLSPVLVVMEFTDCGEMEDWQWQLGVACLFVSYMNMLFFLRIIPMLGRTLSFCIAIDMMPTYYRQDYSHHVCLC